MKYLVDTHVLGAESVEDAQPTVQQLAELEERLSASTQNSLAQAQLLIEKGYLLLALNRQREAWWVAQSAFNIFLTTERWEGAVQACHILFLADQPHSLVALGNGIWLAVTFPIDPELSVVMLEQLVNETPEQADGAAVAGATAHYITDLRATGKVRENLLFFTGQLLAKIARHHSQITHQADFDAWFKKLELDSPPDFLGRLAQILEVIVQDDWWYDRDVLRAQLPT